MVNLKLDQEVTTLRIEPATEEEQAAEWVYRMPCAGVKYYQFAQPRTKPVAREVLPVNRAAESIAA